MTGAGFVGARSVAPPPGGAGGGTTPASGHPSLQEGNVRGSLASAGRPCILLRQLSPVRWSPPGGAGEMSPHHPQPPPTQAPLHLQAAPPANRPACKPPRPKRRSARKSLRLQAVPTKDPNHHALSESRSCDIPLLSGGVAEGRGGRPATAVRPLPTPLAPPPPFCPKGLSLTRRVDGVRVDDGAACFLRKSLPKINNSPLNS